MSQIYRTPITRLADEYTCIRVEHNLQTGRAEHSFTIPTCRVFLEKDSFVLNKLVRHRFTAKIILYLGKASAQLACLCLNFFDLVIHSYSDVLRAWPNI